MAWVPSHQELRDHPKTRKAARRAGVSLPTMIGHLHMLWWWALDHAPEGDLSKYDADDLADAVLWEGDPETFTKALIDCGPGDSDGFLTIDGQLNDWDEYGGKYARRVAAARKAAAVRWQSNGNANSHSERPLEPPECERNANASTSHGRGNAEDSREEDSTNPPSSTDVDREAAESGADDAAHDDASQTFEQFWRIYPKRNGRKVGKTNALIEWRKLTLDERRRAYRGAKHLAASDTLPKDAERFLRRAKGGRGDFPFDDWQQAPSGASDPTSEFFAGVPND